jgi:hypothetical protein
VRSAGCQPVRRAMLYPCVAIWQLVSGAMFKLQHMRRSLLGERSRSFLFVDDTRLCAVELWHMPCCASSTVGSAGEVACIGRGVKQVVELLCSHTWLLAPGMLSSLVSTALCIQHRHTVCCTM